MIEDGGGALDACLAAAFMTWVLMPDMCGLGGDLFALWCDGDGAASVTGAGPSPAQYPGAGDNRAALALVPGAPTALTALKPHLKLPLAHLLAPAIAVAEHGFLAHPLMMRKLATLPGGAFRDDLLASWHWAEGKPLRWPAMAKTLKRLAAGEDPNDLVREALPAWRAAGALLTAADLDAYRATIEQPLRMDVAGWRFFGHAKMSQSVATLGALLRAGPDWLLEPANGINAAAKTHAMIEAYKAVYADLADFGHAGDADAVIARLLDPARARAGRATLGPAASEGPPMARNYGETTQVAAVDRSGRVCTLIHSLYRPFGARALCRETGLIVNDRGGSFTDGANAPAPRQRPRHTLVGIVAQAPGGLRLALGTPAAQAQTQTTLQVIASLMARPDDSLDAVLAPRWGFVGGKTIEVEADMPAAILGDLAARGHQLALRPARDWLMGSVSLASVRDGVSSATADDRRNALALAL
ncbi:MAG: gamma-glutamyltransferase [Pseudolabrys sp.]|nr:gamma-glutamyltransferase [Pseudolabrys sp.]